MSRFSKAHHPLKRHTVYLYYNNLMEIIGDGYMKLVQLFDARRFGCFTYLCLTLLVLLIMSATFPYQRQNAPGCGRLGAGFPLAFVCNYSSGGSPISSMTVIDEADFPFISPVGFLLNFAFYYTLVWILWLAIHNHLAKRPP